MQVWIASIWGIASLMACWSFSLFMRWLSEAIARKQHRLVSQRSDRSFWLGLALIFVCAGVSIFAGVMAVHLGQQFSGSSSPWTTPLVIIGGSATLFGLFMVLWAFIGDRARGRIRCPKCWYDMDGASGLQCPECGHHAENTERFTSTRRPRWAFVVAFGLICAGGYSVSINKRVAQTDWLAAVPSWFLMAGWDKLPENWILSRASPYESTLEDRLDEGWDEGEWISESRSRRFVSKLCRGLLGDAQARWDARRLTLIKSTSETLLRANLYTEDEEWIGAPINPDALLLASIGDLIDATNAQNPSVLELEHLDRMLMRSDWNTNIETPYHLARGWIEEGFANDDPERFKDDYTGWEFQSKHKARDRAVRSHIALITPEDLRSRILNEAFQEQIISIDEPTHHATLMLAHDTKMLEYFLDVLLDPSVSIDTNEPRTRAVETGMYSYGFSPDGVDRLIEGLGALLRSENPRAHAHALSTLRVCMGVLELNEGSEHQGYQEVFELAIERTLGIHTLLYPKSEHPMEFHVMGLLLYLRHDLDGDRVYPLIAERLLVYPDRTPYLNFSYDPFESNAHITAWVEHFAPLADTDDLELKRWLMKNLPAALGTPYDDLLDQIAVGFLGDPDMEVHELAEDKLRARFAEHLITH